MLTIQYLEYSPDLVRLDPSAVAARLRDAAAILPISHLLIGWHLPQNLLETCRTEADRLGMRVLRWQPLLTSDQGITIDPSWYAEGLAGGKVPGVGGLPEFTFLCPNHPAVQDVLMTHLDSILDQGIYQGFFLDRVRFPSLSIDPLKYLACFCEHCCHNAAQDGLDLPEIRKAIIQQASDEEGRKLLIEMLLSGPIDPAGVDLNPAIYQFLAFRQKSVTNFLALIVHHLRAARMEVGLDCFSPSLTPLVGQDLTGLSRHVDWIKLMSYAHTYAPAGLPYEVVNLLNYLTRQTQLDEARAISLISNRIGLTVPKSRHSLEKYGVSSQALEEEIKRGVAAVSIPIMAGIELVDLAGVTQLRNPQIQADLNAIRRAKPSGLAISWDLLHIPMDRLKLVRKVYLEDQ